jgi:hypothetical protein
MRLLHILPIISLPCFLGNTYAEFVHNTNINHVDSGGHYRRPGSVSLEITTVDREALKASIDITKINLMLEEKRKATIKQYEDFKNVPALQSCSSNKTRIDKSKFVASSRSNKFQIDFLIYDRDDFRDSRSAEIWTGKKVAYAVDDPNHLMRFGIWLGLRCLPTRVVLTQRGLEFREGESAFSLSNKDGAEAKALKKELKLLRKSNSK